MKCNGCGYKERQGFIYEDEFYCNDCCGDLLDKLVRARDITNREAIVSHYYYTDGDYVGNTDEKTDEQLLSAMADDITGLKKVKED